MSPLALEIHVRAVDHSVHTECPAFISDTSLDGIAPARVTTMAALELCLAEVWHRAQDGYVIADFDLIDHLSVSRHPAPPSLGCAGCGANSTASASPAVISAASVAATACRIRFSAGRR